MTTMIYPTDEQLNRVQRAAMELEEAMRACGYKSEQVTAAWFGRSGKARAALQTQTIEPAVTEQTE